ncbi:LutC/YkgG family protein [Blastococcus mobilis]|uniref:L-lactate dehydrogenase complex protein LldG n=1 Tax=Blastococcus mobilis TaxID=1938746 RepID=A0A239AGE5_9ACTN|nr:lactate utilization protein C [Blastococcus mobilis]SNR94609.1 L-lactate dehydrogenase complex protein LldG [Blastococcus mobilis]
MTGARDEVLGRIRTALGDVPPEETSEDFAVPRDYRRHREHPEGDVERFSERVADYKATVERVRSDGVATAVTAALSRVGATRVGVPAGLPEEWAALTDGGVALVRDTVEEPLSVADLDALDAVVTGSTVGIAETGTIVLESGVLCGRRALTLVPDVHVCIVRAEDVVDDVPAAVTRLRTDRPLTWISGPSATSDIELDRVEGVHGPRTLHVIVVGGDRS